MLYVGIGVLAVIVIVSFIYNYKRSKAINENGIEADAVISRVKEIETENSDGTRDVKYEYYVQYTDQNGSPVQAKLGNPPRFAREGMELRIKYLPDKPKYVISIKE